MNDPASAPDPRGSSSDEQERASRLHALEALAREHGVATAPSAPNRIPMPSGRRPWVLVGASAALLIALLVGAIAFQSLRSARPSSGAPAGQIDVTLNLLGNGYSCPSAVAWSPDGQRLAVLAQRGFCRASGAGGANDTVLIFDAARGKLLKALDLAGTLKPIQGQVT
jgi:hypothetical protein